ncbi:hypothetical protein RHIZ404_140006 [Rhizobium sp. EC-SD404]|nr:hypothetical protein RHIZ404_140006 [Rhizobium sp. EC-SD404]
MRVLHMHRLASEAQSADRLELELGGLERESAQASALEHPVLRAPAWAMMLAEMLALELARM